MPQNQKARNLIAKMKLVPVFQIIKNKKFVLIDDSIVRGTQLSETVSYLIENGAKDIHVRSACPPIMYGCKYLNFSRSVSDLELITRRCIRELEGMDDPGDAAANPAGFDNAVQSDIPRDILEASRIDGCSRFRTLWNIYVPMSKPALATSMMSKISSAIWSSVTKMWASSWRNICTRNRPLSSPDFSLRWMVSTWA